MRTRVVFAGILAALLWSAPVAMAQLPGGISIPGAGTSLLSKDTLLTQAKQLVSDLTAMKSNKSLAPDQAKQVDELLPKANSLQSELEAPSIDAGRLPQLAKNLTDLQKQVSSLKGMVK